jgi:hypothetical protein
VTTVRDNFPGVDISDWRETLAARGYDVSIAERTLAEGQDTLSAPMAKLPLLFDPEFYVAAYPDIAAARVDPYDHYVEAGCAEGRLPRTPALDALVHFGSMTSKLETVLVVSHEGVRGGARPAPFVRY